MVNQDGTELETLNHIGRHELHSYFDRALNDDALDEFIVGELGADQPELDPQPAPPARALRRGARRGRHLPRRRRAGVLHPLGRTDRLAPRAARREPGRRRGRLRHPPRDRRVRRHAGRLPLRLLPQPAAALGRHAGRGARRRAERRPARDPPGRQRGDARESDRALQVPPARPGGRRRRLRRLPEVRRRADAGHRQVAQLLGPRRAGELRQRDDVGALPGRGALAAGAAARRPASCPPPRRASSPTSRCRSRRSATISRRGTWR